MTCHTLLSLMYASDGHHQIILGEEDQPNMSFIARIGGNNYKVMTFEFDIDNMCWTS